jgi:hypothetical protein
MFERAKEKSKSDGPHRFRTIRAIRALLLEHIRGSLKRAQDDDWLSEGFDVHDVA